jgi:PiT family inorganic phosphate transporter
MVIVLVLLALVFVFMNGFYDATYSISTVVSTGVLKPKNAVEFAAFFNAVAVLFFSLAVATSVGRGTIEASIVDQHVVLGALVAAIAWNGITWYYGIPWSSSHALIGGLIGAAVAKAGPSSLVTSGVIKTFLFVIISPALGFLLGALLMIAVSWIFFRTPQARVDKWFRRLQLVSAGLYHLGHGGNDAQKTIGIIWMVLLAAGMGGTAVAEAPPTWVIVSCYAAMGMGTLLGGWRIAKTAMGQKITKLKPSGGSCAEAGGGLALFVATSFGIPVSTGHTLSGAIVGVGSSNRFSAVRWGAAHRNLLVWILTIPCSGLIAAIVWRVCARITTSF